MHIKFFQNIIDILRGKKHLNIILSPGSVKYSNLEKNNANPTNTFENLVAIQGFGHSGSGALIDYLSEFQNITVLGHHDTNGSLYNKKSTGEIDFVRRYGGLVDLESAFLTRNNNIRDFKLKNFITLIEYYFKTNDLYDNKFLNLTNEFINEIVDFKFKTETGCECNPAFMAKLGFQKDYKNLSSPFLFEHKKTRWVYYLKELSVSDYRSIANKYIMRILNTINSKKILVLDQFISDDNLDLEMYKDYLGEFKLIAVYRDPRDVYATGKILNECWIPTDVESFIKWYKYHNSIYVNKKNTENYMILRFEDLVLNYTETTEKILNFLDIDNEKNQIYLKKFFNPNVSIKNVGIYKQIDDKDAIRSIERNLKEFCFDNNKCEKGKNND